MASASENIEMEDGLMVFRDPVLFQVFLDEKMIQERLQILKQYSYKYGTPESELKNCFNLTLAALGLVNANYYYLGACSDRPYGSSFDEMGTYIRESLALCHLPFSIEFFFIPPHEFKDKYVPELRRNYGTILLLGLADDKGHATLLYKNLSGVTFLVDPQLEGPDGSYPLTIVGEDAIQAFLLEKVTHVGGVASRGIISEIQSRSGRCMSDVSPVWQNNTKGGYKKRGKRTRKAKRSL